MLHYKNKNQSAFINRILVCANHQNLMRISGSKYHLVWVGDSWLKHPTDIIFTYFREHVPHFFKIEMHVKLDELERGREKLFD